jgi:hypothetical protein
MDRLILVIALACIAAAPVRAQKLEIRPYPVKQAAGDVTGTFKVSRSAGGIESIGSGGACLVADLRASGIGGQACATDNDCSGDSRFSGSHGYCLGPDDEPKACWIRPGSQRTHCHLSATEPLPLNRKVPLPTVAAKPLPDGKPVRWLVLACLNGAAGACGDASRTDRMKVAGRVRTIP